MKYDVVVEIAQPELVAATRATIPLGDIPRTWKPALDRVWAFLKTRRDLDPGHNLFLYHHPAHRHEAMNIDFGVQVARPFAPEGDVNRDADGRGGEDGSRRSLRSTGRCPRRNPRLVPREQPGNRAGFVGNLRRLDRGPGSARNDDQIFAGVTVSRWRNPSDRIRSILVGGARLGQGPVTARVGVWRRGLRALAAPASPGWP